VAESAPLRQQLSMADLHGSDFEIVGNFLEILRSLSKRLFQLRLMRDPRQARSALCLFTASRLNKVDRPTRSLADFAKIVEIFDGRGVSFVSVTQQFNTTSSMGRLTLNVLLSFAQFEREVTGERIRDKIAASKKKGIWMGGLPPIGY